MKLTPARTPRAGGRMTALPFLIVALAISEVATAPAAPPIADFPVPSISSDPTTIAVGPDANMWFTEQATNKIGRITPLGGVTEYAVPNAPAGIVAGPDGNLWITEPSANKIARMTPSGLASEFSVPTTDGYPFRIAVGADGNLWFTEQRGNKIGRISTSGVIAEFLRTNSGSHPTGIAAGPDGNIWYTVLSGGVTCDPIACHPTEQPWIGRITPGGVITEFPLTIGSQPSGISSGPDGNVWFTELVANKIGRITPSGNVTEFPIPSAHNQDLGGGRIHFGVFAGPEDIAAGADGNVWFTESVSNRIGRVSVSGHITEFQNPTSCPEGLGLDCLTGIASGPHGEVWATQPAANRIARIDILSDPTINLFWRQTQTGDLDLWSMNGPRVNAALRLASGVALEWQIVGIGDLDFNGVDDLIWRNNRTGDVAAWLMKGSSVIESAVVSPGVPLNWQIIGVGDVSGDGKADLIWRDKETGDVAVWEMNGAAVNVDYGYGLPAPVTPVISTGLPLTWQLAGVGDLDGDGYADLIWRDSARGDVSAWLMTRPSPFKGNWIWQSSIVKPPATDDTFPPSPGIPPLLWQIAGVGDVNGDGKADLIWYSAYGDAGEWIMNGAVANSVVITYGVPLDWRLARVGDFNGDGNVDLVWRNTQSGGVAEWMLYGAAVIGFLNAWGPFEPWQIQ